MVVWRSLAGWCVHNGQQVDPLSTGRAAKLGEGLRVRRVASTVDEELLNGPGEGVRSLAIKVSPFLRRARCLACALCQVQNNDCGGSGGHNKNTRGLGARRESDIRERTLRIQFLNALLQFRTLVCDTPLLSLDNDRDGGCSSGEA